jgi:hypothetical protein
MLKNVTTVAAWLIAGPRVAVKTRSLFNNFERSFAGRETLHIRQADGSTVTVIVPQNSRI